MYQGGGEGRGRGRGTGKKSEEHFYSSLHSHSHSKPQNQTLKSNISYRAHSLIDSLIDIVETHIVTS